MPNSSVNNALSWLVGALGLDPATFPAWFAASEPVTPAVDVLQGGWAVATWQTALLTRAQSLGSALTTVAAADPTKTRLITALSLSRTGGAGTARPLVGFYDPVSTATMTLAGVDLLAGDLKGWDEWADGAPYWIVPPNYAIRFFYPATAAGETFDGRMVIGTFPAGAKPI